MTQTKRELGKGAVCVGCSRSPHCASNSGHLDLCVRVADRLGPLWRVKLGRWRGELSTEDNGFAKNSGADSGWLGRPEYPMAVQSGSALSTGDY